MILPSLLTTMIEEGIWSTPGSHCDSRIPTSTARRWDPHALGVYLIDKPTPLSIDIERVPYLTNLWNTVDVDPRQCLVIADFGLGSDNPIVLDYSVDPPAVRTQHWTLAGQQPEWITIARTFDDFVEALGLTPQ